MSTIGVQMSGIRIAGDRMSGVAAFSSQQPAAARTRLRITRRGRAALAALVAVPLAAVGLYFGMNAGAAAADSGAPTHSVSFQHVTVQPGQSLWQIAERIAPNADPRDVVAGIVDLNALSSSVVTPGETLAIPLEYSAHK